MKNRERKMSGNLNIRYIASTVWNSFSSFPLSPITIIRERGRKDN
jgi:hypothetical protein